MRMLDVLSIGPILLLGTAYYVSKRRDTLEEQGLAFTAKPSASTGDKDLDAILGIKPSLPIEKISS